MRRPRWMAAALVAATVTACAGPTATQDDTERPDAPAASPTEREAQDPDVEDPPRSPTSSTDRPALAFSGRTLGGGSLDGASLSGHVILWFWAPW